jgi:hypothetical protein
MYLYDEELAKEIRVADSVSIYRSVFVKHGCSEEDYKKAVARYAKKPKAMKGIYEAVKARLEGYKAEFEQALKLENYLQDLAGSPYDTLLYMSLDDDSTAHRRVYLPKFRLVADSLNSLDSIPFPLIVVPERPDQPVQAAQPPVQLKQFAKPDKLDKPRRTVHPVRPTQPVERLKRLP